MVGEASRCGLSPGWAGSSPRSLPKSATDCRCFSVGVDVRVGRGGLPGSDAGGARDQADSSA